jgi:hypothetical protein
MITPPIPHFLHRFNHEGNWESMCSECFLTVAKAKLETDLEAHEENHVCEGQDLKGIFSPRPHTHS